MVNMCVRSVCHCISA